MASRVGEYLLFDTLGQGSFAKYVWPWWRCSEFLRLRVVYGGVWEAAQWVLVVWLVVRFGVWREERAVCFRW